MATDKQPRTAVKNNLRLLKRKSITSTPFLHEIGWARPIPRSRQQILGRCAEGVKHPVYNQVRQGWPISSTLRYTNSLSYLMLPT